MRRSPLLIATLITLAQLSLSAKDPVDYVDPLIGAEGNNADYPGLMPLVGPPFAMTSWTPMTRLNEVGRTAYLYNEATIIGFQGTHQPSIWMGDYGQVSLMPGIGPVRVNYNARRLPFQHPKEKATPYQYSVTMGHPESEIEVTLSATARTAVMEYKYPKDSEAHVVFDASRKYPNARYSDRGAAEGWVKIDKEKREVTGYNKDRQTGNLQRELPNFAGYFVIVFDQPVLSTGTYVDESLKENETEAKADQVGGFVRFGKVAKVRAQIGTSFISVDEARKNLQREQPQSDLQATAKATREAWARQLSKITVESVKDDDKTLFYTAMYRTHLTPREFSENGHYYSAFDNQVHDGTAYQDFQLWSGYRAALPLLMLTAPERVGPMVRSLVEVSAQSGWLPLAPNPGDTGLTSGAPAEAFIAEACVKGLRDFDLTEAYKAVKHHAVTPQSNDMEKRWGDRQANGAHPETRAGLTWYMSKGYVAADKTEESVSRTLEYSYSDYCDALLAEAAGDKAGAQMFRERSQNYRNLYYDGLFRPKKTDGTWGAAGRAFTDGSDAIYAFSALHDLPWLIGKFGGNEAFQGKLDDLFGKNGKYRHDSEPAHHIAYLFDYCGQPWKTQAKVRELLSKYYQAKPAGFAGNESGGQIFAWYIFSSLGFYPVTPVSGEYAIGSPIWDSATITLGAPYQPATLRIVCEKQSTPNIYVQSVSLNGKPLEKPFISHAELIKGGELKFVMGPEHQ